MVRAVCGEAREPRLLKQLLMLLEQLTQDAHARAALVSAGARAAVDKACTYAAAGGDGGGMQEAVVATAMAAALSLVAVTRPRAEAGVRAFA
jgi:hypothetical protein